MNRGRFVANLLAIMHHVAMSTAPRHRREALDPATDPDFIGADQPEPLEGPVSTRMLVGATAASAAAVAVAAWLIVTGAW